MNYTIPSAYFLLTFLVEIPITLSPEPGLLVCLLINTGNIEFVCVYVSEWCHLKCTNLKI